MAFTRDFVDYVLDQLSSLGKVTSRRMFGGVGIYCDGAFFALIADDVLYLKVGEHNRADFESRGMAPFRPFKDKPHTSLSYYELPADVLEDAEQCALWAQRSLAIATPRKAKSAGKRRSKPVSGSGI